MSHSHRFNPPVTAAYARGWNISLITIPDYFQELMKGKHALPDDAQFTNLRHAARDIHQIAEIAALTGETNVNKLVTYPVARLSFLETTALIETEMQILDEEKLPEIVQTIYRKHVKPALKAEAGLDARISHRVDRIARDALDDKATSETPYFAIASAIRKTITERYQSGKYKLGSYLTLDVDEQGKPLTTPEAQLNEWIYRVVFDRLYQQIALAHVHGVIMSVLNVLIDSDKTPYERMTHFSGDKRHTFMLSGAPACGKGEMIDSIAPGVQITYGVNWADVIKINTDVHRRIVSHDDILGEEKTLSVRLNGDEAVFITDRAYELVRAKIKNNSAPHLLIDGAMPGEDRIEMGIANHGKLHWFIMTASVEESIARAFRRGLKTDRYVMTDYMLRTHKIMPARFFEILRQHKGRDIDFAILDSEVPMHQMPIKILEGNLLQKDMTLYDEKLFALFCGRQNLQLDARSPDDLFRSEKDKTSVDYLALLKSTDLQLSLNTPRSARDKPRKGTK